ncbi:hypothetical protein [Nonlabens sp.]|uniref:hypothetical protein n=1 Tax=Nonlabens sp. TaxID=1888209 RepID=UPI003F69E7C7
MRTFAVFLLLPLLVFSQIEINPNPATINSGIMTITYGAQGDYTLFDPMSDPNLLLYTGLETDGVTATWDFHDDFADISTLVPFNYDNTLGYYIAQIDVAGRTYVEEPNLNITTIPAGTQVNDWYFLIATTDLSRQSADLKGSDYGWQQATLSNDVLEELELFKIMNQKLIYSGSDVITLHVYGLSGALIHTTSIKDAITDLSFLPKDQLFLLRLESHKGVKVIKYLN